MKAGVVMPNDVMRKARERFDENLEATKACREEYARNVAFTLWDDQWDDGIKSGRSKKGRPSLVANNIAPMVNHLVSRNVANRPGVTIIPADEYGDDELANILMATVRGIERNSNAGEDCYRAAFTNFTIGGFGFVLLTVQYKGANTFEREILFKAVWDPRSIVWDVRSFWEDVPFEYAFRVIHHTKESFEREYPKKDATSFVDASQWVGYAPHIKDPVTIVEYWERKRKKVNLISYLTHLDNEPQPREVTVDEQTLFAEAVVFFNGVNVPLDDLGKTDIINEYLRVTNSTVQERRVSFKYVITRRILSRNEILEEEPFPGEIIPVIMGYTVRGINRGKLRFQNLVSTTIDAQRLKNYSLSNKAEQVGKSNNKLILGPRGMIPFDKKKEWSYSNLDDNFYLEVDPDACREFRPQVIQYTPVVADPIMEQAWQEIQRSMGIYESQLGSHSNEVSGVAISKREEQGQSSNNHYRVALANLIVALISCAVAIIIEVYRKNKHVNAVSESDNTEMMENPFAKFSDEAKSATWSTTVQTGPPYATQKEEANAKLLEILKANPESMGLIGDIVVGNMRFPGNDVVRNRLRMQLPDAIREAENVQDENHDPKVLQLEIVKMQSELEAQKELIKEGAAQIQELEKATALVKERDRQQFLIKERELELKELEMKAKFALEESKLTLEKTEKEDELETGWQKFALEMEFKAAQNDQDRRVALAKADKAWEDACGFHVEQLGPRVKGSLPNNELVEIKKPAEKDEEENPSSLDYERSSDNEESR